jgi:hypothetical protein
MLIPHPEGGNHDEFVVNASRCATTQLCLDGAGCLHRVPDAAVVLVADDEFQN